MLTVGLSGGIGAGKSAVSVMLADRGALIIDYDQLARQVVAPGSAALGSIVERFGASILLPDGSLDRPALGAIVFADAIARRQLEAITHAAIIERAVNIQAGAAHDAIVVHDNPLLVEMGGNHQVDVVVIVDLPVDLQVERLVTSRGFSEADARARIAAQATREERLAAADYVIDNSGSLEDLTRAVDRVWGQLCQAAGATR